MYHQFANTYPICQSITNLPIYHQSMSICQSYTNPGLLCQSIAISPIQCHTDHITITKWPICTHLSAPIIKNWIVTNWQHIGTHWHRSCQSSEDKAAFNLGTRLLLGPTAGLVGGRFCVLIGSQLVMGVLLPDKSELQSPIRQSKTNPWLTWQFMTNPR